MHHHRPVSNCSFRGRYENFGPCAVPAPPRPSYPHALPATHSVHFRHATIHNESSYLQEVQMGSYTSEPHSISRVTITTSA